MKAYIVKMALCGVSPMVWHRFRLSGETSLAGFYFIIHIIDCFHIMMRLTVLNQYVKGVLKRDPERGTELSGYLTIIKWSLWHGNVDKALEYLDYCAGICDDDTLHYENNKALLKHFDEMYSYIRNNSMMIPNYGEMYRYGEPISSSFVESTINGVIAKRMVKKQQMQWSQQGAI